jgi:hypothetical protein
LLTSRIATWRLRDLASSRLGVFATWRLRDLASSRLHVFTSEMITLRRDQEHTVTDDCERDWLST